VYLFKSEATFTAYPNRTLQCIFQLAKAKAGISKGVGVHSSRYSFAMHLPEKGIDVKYIKELPGHFDIRTTERYFHVSKEKLVNIISPLDSLYKEEIHLRIADTDNTKKRKGGIDFQWLYFLAVSYYSVIFAFMRNSFAPIEQHC